MRPRSCLLYVARSQRGRPINAKASGNLGAYLPASRTPGLTSNLIRLAHVAALPPNESLQVKLRFALEHIIDRSSELMRQHRQGLAFAMFFL
jgi:hypothetical protein